MLWFLHVLLCFSCTHLYFHTLRRNYHIPFNIIKHIRSSIHCLFFSGCSLLEPSGPFPCFSGKQCSCCLYPSLRDAGNPSRTLPGLCQLFREHHNSLFLSLFLVSAGQIFWQLPQEGCVEGNFVVVVFQNLLECVLHLQITEKLTTAMS